MKSFALTLLFAFMATAGELPLVNKVEFQPMAAQTIRLLDALSALEDPLPAADAGKLRKLASQQGGSAESVAEMQRILDRYCLIGVEINPESRVKVQQGVAKAELVQNGWRNFLIKVENQAGTTPVLAVDSPNAGQLANRPPQAFYTRFLDLQIHRKQPMRGHLSGLGVEYQILQITSKDAGKREAKLIFDVGQGTQDLGFRSEVDVLFTILPANKVTFRVSDENGKPAVASLLIRDRSGRVYPSLSKRVAPDFFFHSQIYRADGENVLLPDGVYTIEYGRGPEYLKNNLTLKVDGKPEQVDIKLARWIDPAKDHWYSGDHHIHAAGCSHYEKPAEGVYPADMMRHILGEDLKVGSVLTWGPGWYFQKTFFEGKEHDLSTSTHKMRYDVEVSGFPSSHTGHLILLRAKEQDYPKTKRIEDWPSWGLPVLQWGKTQNAITGFAHSGWGLRIPEAKLLSYDMPPFDGIGANEFIVSVAHDAVDFISAVDTPYHWELNIWYHTLNAGYRTRISGETDFPCIYDQKVGLGRSYVRQKDKLDYDDWTQGIREGRDYVSDGMSHLMDFAVNGLSMGEQSSELKVTGGQKLTATARVGALLDSAPDPEVRGKSADQKPYWHIERARIGNTRKVPVELIFNGEVVGRTEINADGTTRPITFDYTPQRSGWVAMRILPSSHTNPVFVIVDGKPIREAKSLEWCVRAVNQCWKMKEGNIRLSERGEAQRAYDYARQMYQQRLKEAQ